MLAFATAAGTLSGCIGGDDGPSRAEYIRALVVELNRVFSHSLMMGFEDFFVKTVVPKTEEELNRLRELPKPEGDEGMLTSLYEDIQAALDKIKRDPGALTKAGSNGLAPAASEQARRYNFQVCFQSS